MKLTFVIRPLPMLHVTALAIAGLSGPLAAQTATGSVAGRVTDAVTQAYLAGAEVALAGTAFTATVDRGGAFEIPDVPFGSYTLNVSFLGYQMEKRALTVGAGRATAVEVKLTPEVVQMQAFVVEGAREGQARAINQQKAAINLKNLISADAIGNFPDQNAADALQRVADIAVERSRGEAETITIRGAASNFNSVSLDGLSQGANDQNGRTVKLIDYPSEMLAGIEVIKSATPDMDGDSIGGHVALKSKSAFDTSRRVLALNLYAQYNDLAENWGYRSGLTFTSRFGRDGDWGVALSAIRHDRKGLEENLDRTSVSLTTLAGGGQSYSALLPGTIQLNNEDFERTKTSGSLTLEKKFANDTRLHARFTQSKYMEKTHRPSLFYRIGTTLDATKPVVVEDGRFMEFSVTNGGADKNVNPRTYTDTMRNVALGGSARVGDWKFGLESGFSEGTRRMDVASGRFRSTGSTALSVNLRDPDYPVITANSGTDLTNPASYAFNQGQARDRSILSREYLVQADAERPVDLKDSRLTLKFGAKGRWGTRNWNDDLWNWNSLAPGQTLAMMDPRFAGVANANPGFLGRYSLGATFDPELWRIFLSQNPGVFTLNQGQSLQGTIANDYDINEDIVAGYAMATWTRGAWNALAGVRVEETEFVGQGFGQNNALPTTNPARYFAQKFTTKYTNVLPGVHLRFEPRKNLVLRASWNSTLARPETNKAAPTQSVNYPTNPSVTDPIVVSGGNPRLQATTSDNFDLAAEYYLSSIGVVSVGWFHKNLDGPVYTSTFTGEYQGQPARYSASANAGKAPVSGWEFTYQQNFRMLPSPFDGLGFTGNYTHVDSHVDVPTRPGERFPLFKQSDEIANLAVTYQKYGVFARLAWNYTGPYLKTLGSSAALDDWQGRYRILDLLVNYKLSARWKVTLEGNNLTNEPNVEYLGAARYGAFYANIGRSYAVGLNWNY